MVSIVWYDRELSQRRSKHDAPEARTVSLLPSHEDRRLALVIYCDVVFGKNNFVIGVTDWSEANQGVMEGRLDFSGSGEFGG